MTACPSNPQSRPQFADDPDRMIPPVVASVAAFTLVASVVSVASFTLVASVVSVARASKWLTLAFFLGGLMFTTPAAGDELGGDDLVADQSSDKPTAVAGATDGAQSGATNKAGFNQDDESDSQAMDVEPVQMLGPGGEPPQTLAPLIDLAERARLQFDTVVDAYTCLLVKRETIDGNLEPAQYLRLKIRDRRVDGDRLVQPLSIYAKFLKPQKVAGREVLYVEDQRDGNLLVRRGGTRLPNLTLTLSPSGRLAKTDTNYSITQTGIRPMLQQILDRMKAQPADAPVQIRLFADAKVDGRSCQHIEIRQLKRHPQSDYQVAKVYIDDEWKLPVYFASYAWPDDADGDPVLQEQYVITKINLAAELTDADFDRENPAYQFRPEEEPEEESGEGPEEENQSGETVDSAQSVSSGRAMKSDRLKSDR